MTDYKLEKAQLYRTLFRDISKSLNIDYIINEIFQKKRSTFEDFWKTVPLPGIQRDDTENKLTIRKRYDELKTEAEEKEKKCELAIGDFSKEIKKLGYYSTTIGVVTILSSGALVLPAAFTSLTQVYTFIIAGLALIAAVLKLLAENLQLNKTRDKHVKALKQWEEVKNKARKYLNFIDDIIIPNDNPTIFLDQIKNLSDEFYNTSIEYKPPNVKL